MLGRIGILARRNRDGTRIVECPLRAGELPHGQQRACQEHEVVGPEERRACDRLRGQPFLEHAESAAGVAELQHGPPAERGSPLHLLCDAMSMTDDRELFVDPLHVPRAAPGEMRKDFEEQRKGQRLRVPSAMPVRSTTPDLNQPFVGKPEQRQGARVFGPAEDSRFHPGLPDPAAMEGGVVQFTSRRRSCRSGGSDRTRSFLPRG